MSPLASLTPTAVYLPMLLATTLLLAGCQGQNEAPEPPPVEAMPGMEMDEETQDAAAMPGMDMGGEDSMVRLTQSDLRNFGVTFGTAEVRPLSRRIRATGTVEFDETRTVRVAPKFRGWAERLLVDFTGRTVRAGEPLLEVYAPELVTAQEELLLAARMVEDLGESPLEEVAEGAADLLASARRRLAYWDISQEQIDAILETGEVRRTLALHAPASGVVTEKAVVEGQSFQAGTILYTIAGLNRVWVIAEVFESDVGLIRSGIPVEVVVNALPGETFTGRVDYVYPTVGERSRSMRARVVLPNPGGRLKPGMYATMRLEVDLGERLTVPTSAVLRTGERAVAFVDMGGGSLMPHELELGVRGDDRVAVRSGLEPGDRVVTSAQFILDSESNLAEVMQAMMAQMGSGASMDGMEGMDMDGGDDQMPGMNMGPGGGAPNDSAGGP